MPFLRAESSFCRGRSFVRVSLCCACCCPQFQVGEYKESHQEDISQLAFHPELPSHLVSGGEDGLVCVFDTNIAGMWRPASSSKGELAFSFIMMAITSCN